LRRAAHAAGALDEIVVPPWTRGGTSGGLERMLNLDMLSARREVGARLPVEDEHENDEEDDFSERTVLLL
jgi:hypothetical protein